MVEWGEGQGLAVSPQSVSQSAFGNEVVEEQPGLQNFRSQNRTM